MNESNNNKNNNRSALTDRIFAFENTMDRTRALLGWVYLPIHIFVLPLALSAMASFSSVGLSEADANLIYYVIGLIFVAGVMLPFLRSGFDALLDRPGRCLFSMVVGVALTYLLSSVAALALLLLEEAGQNPNTAEVLELAQAETGKVRAVAIFLAPVVEEVLFRGVVFGSLRQRSRALAYVLGALIFALYHVWQPALVYRDPRLLLYALQYLPVTVALLRVYERSGSIWPCIFFHMGFNALSLNLLGM